MVSTKTLYELGLVTVIMLVLDAVWLTGNSAYHRQVFAALQGQPLQVRWIPAAAVYVLMIAAVWYFAVAPAADWMAATGRGAFIGAVMYGLYDFTNYATLVHYPLRYTLTDFAWGVFLCGAVAGLTRAIMS